MVKAFDIVAPLEDDNVSKDVNAFALSSALTKDALKASELPQEVFAPHFNDTAFNAQLDNAYRSHITANLPKPEVDNPSLDATMKAAFQTGNMVGSILSSDTLREYVLPTKDSKQLTDDQIIEQVGKANMLPLLQKFQGVTTQAELEARMSDIQREQDNQRVLEASGVSGTVALLAAGIVDLPTLIPVGKALQLGRKGASLLENVGKTAAAGAIDAGISEAGLQSSQQLRTADEGVINVASGAILGAALGGAIHKLVGHEVADKVVGDLDAYRADAANNFAAGRKAVADLDAASARANDLGPRKGFVRMYHGGVDQPEGFDGPLWFSTDRKYAQGYADKSGDAGHVFYVDVPDNHPSIYDEALIGQNAKDGSTHNVELPAEITRGRTKLSSNVEASPATVTGSSVGATFSDLAAEAAAHGKKSDAKISAWLLDKIPNITTVPTEFLSKVIGGKTLLGRPRDAFAASALDTVRQFRRMFYSAPEISVANAEGKVGWKGMTVEDHIGEDLGKLSEFKATVANVYAKNSSRFRSVNDLAEQAYYAALNEGIDTIGADPAIEEVARAFNKYADYQHAKHVANGRLPENTPVMGTPGGYVRRSYNQTALRNNEETAREMLYQWALRKVQQDADELDAETGYTEKLARYNESVNTFEARKAKRETDFNEAMKVWKETRDNLVGADAAAYNQAMHEWRENTSEFLSNPANDGKKPKFLKPQKKNFNSVDKWLEDNPRPRKGEAETLTDGNAKPALPRNKHGIVLTKNEVPEQARLLAEDVYNTLAGVKSSVPRAASSRVGVRTGYLKGRVVDIPDDVMGNEFFLKTNLLEHAETMHYTSGRDAALGSVFKMRDDYGNLVGDYDGNSVIKAAEEEADAVINETTGEAKTRLIEERDRMLTGMQNEIDIARGKFNVGSGLIGAEAAHHIASVAYFSRLGGVTVTSLTDAPKIAIANGLGNTFRYGVLPMLRDFRATIGRNGVLRSQGVRVGTVTEILHDTRMADAFELNNPYASGSKWGAFVDKATKLGTQLSLIAHWTDLGKQVAHNITSSRILGYADIGWDRLSQKNRAWLTNLGLDAEDMAKVKAEYDAQDLKHVAGVLYADLDKWKDQDLAARFGAAFRREGRSVVVAPGLGDRPQFNHTPEGKLINQFQTFMLTDQIRFFARQAQLANVASSSSERLRQQIAFGAGLSSLVLGAVFVDSMKRAMRDNEVDWNAFVQRWEDNPGGSIYDAIDRAGFMGSLFNASNTAGKFSNGVYSIRGGTQWLAGDVDPGDARKVRDIGLGGALFGPAAGIGEDAVKSLQAVGKAAAGGTLSRADLRRFQNLLPYHAVPGIQQSLNAINELAASSMGLPPETKNLGH